MATGTIAERVNWTRTSGVVLCPAHARHCVITVIDGIGGCRYVQWCSLLSGEVHCEQRCLSLLPTADRVQPGAAMSVAAFQQLQPFLATTCRRLEAVSADRFVEWRGWAMAALAGVCAADTAWRAAERARAEVADLACDDPLRRLGLAAEVGAWACVQACRSDEAAAMECLAHARNLLGSVTA